MIDIFNLISKSRQDLLKERNTHFSQSLHTDAQYKAYVQAQVAAQFKQYNETKGTND